MLDAIVRLFGGTDDESTPDVETTEREPAVTERPQPRVDEEPPGPDTTELENRLDDLEDDVESTTTSLEAVRNAQDEMNDSVDEINDTVRQLVGVYDQFAASQNPFVDDEPRGDGAGVAGAEPDDETVSFDDLADGDANGQVVDEEEDGDDHDDTGAHDDHDDTGAHDDHDDTDDTSGHDDHGRDDSTAARDDGGPDHRPLLETVPEGYAGDVLLMEWLSRLVERSGPAGALRAVEHYHDLGLVSTAVRDHVVEVLGGPSLDVFVDPMQPHEPTVEEHEVSTTYLKALGRLED
jgi:archaellum component FlaD/FlaE/archaellum component FlaC